MNIFRFRDFPVYQAAMQFRRKWKDISKRAFPVDEQYVLRPQFWRALDSVVLNIAEGSERYSDKDFGHFLNISTTSVTECVAVFDCAANDGYITAAQLAQGLEEAENIVKQLKSFAAYLRAHQKL